MLWEGQTGCWARLTSCWMGTGGERSFLRGEVAGAWGWLSSSVVNSKWTAAPPYGLLAVQRQTVALCTLRYADHTTQCDCGLLVFTVMAQTVWDVRLCCRVFRATTGCSDWQAVLLVLPVRVSPIAVCGTAWRCIIILILYVKTAQLCWRTILVL